jgi:hypothetical protein
MNEHKNLFLLSTIDLIMGIARLFIIFNVSNISKDQNEINILFL